MKRMLWAIVLSAGTLGVFAGCSSHSASREQPVERPGTTGEPSACDLLQRVSDEPDLFVAVVTASLDFEDRRIDVTPYQTKLDAMISAIRTRLEKKGIQTKSDAIPVINDYLFQELQLEPVSDAQAEDTLLPCVLDRGRGNSMGLAILYLSLGKRLNLPLYGVVTPGCIFVRYDDGSVRFNIELTRRGDSLSDEYYTRRLRLPAGDAESIYMKNLSEQQAFACFLNNLGNLYLGKGGLDAAVAAFQNGIRLLPSLAELHANLGNVYLQKGMTQEAVDQYEQSLRLNPNDPKTHSNLGNVHYREGRLDDAASCYQRALQLAPDFVDGHRNMALLLTKREQYDKAMSHLNRAVALDGSDAAVYIQIGELCVKMHEYEKGMERYREALRLQRDSAEAHYGLGMCYGGLGKVAKEIESYKEALRLKPAMLGALVDLGTAYFNQADYDQAARCYEQAAAIKPDDSRILFNLGSTHMKRGKFDASVKAYLQAVQLDPKMTDVHHALAYDYYQLAKYDLAWKHVNLAREGGVAVPTDLVEAIRRRVEGASKTPAK